MELATSTDLFTPIALGEPIEEPREDIEMPNSEGPPNKRRRKKSIVWEHFSIETVGPDCKRACCKQCKKSFAYITGTKLAGTSHLKRHISLGICPAGRQKHEASQHTPAAKSDPPKRRYRSSPGYTIIPFDQECCTHDLAKMIIQHDYPLHIVEHPAFVDFVHTLHPQYNMVSFNTIQGECVGLYLREKQRLLDHISGIPGRVNLTLDLATSNLSIGYAFVTGHFIDNNWILNRRILNVIMLPFPDSDYAFNQAVVSCRSDWHLESKLLTFTLDKSFSNETMIGNLRGLLSVKNSLLLNGQLVKGSCYARVLSQLAQEAMGKVQEPIRRIRDCVKYVKTSVRHDEKFTDLRQQLQVPSTRELMIDDQTKWNTTYQMLAAACELKEVFNCLDTADPVYKINPSVNDWKQVEILCTYLKLFFDATSILTSPTYPPANAFYHEVSKIQLELTHAAMSQDPFVSSLTRPLKERFDQYWKECFLVLALAVVMDPRFKMKLVEFSFSKMFGEDAGSWIKIVDDCIHELFLDYIAPPPLATMMLQASTHPRIDQLETPNQVMLVPQVDGPSQEFSSSDGHSQDLHLEEAKPQDLHPHLIVQDCTHVHINQLETPNEVEQMPPLMVQDTQTQDRHPVEMHPQELPSHDRPPEVPFGGMGTRELSHEVHQLEAHPSEMMHHVEPSSEDIRTQEVLPREMDSHELLSQELQHQEVQPSLDMHTQEEPISQDKEMQEVSISQEVCMEEVHPSQEVHMQGAPTSHDRDMQEVPIVQEVCMEEVHPSKEVHVQGEPTSHDRGMEEVPISKEVCMEEVHPSQDVRMQVEATSQDRDMQEVPISQVVCMEEVHPSQDVHMQGEPTSQDRDVQDIPTALVVPLQEVPSSQEIDSVEASAQEITSLGATPQEMLPQEAPTPEMHSQEAPSQEMPNQDIRSQEVPNQDVQDVAASAQEMPSLGAGHQEMLPQEAPMLEMHNQEAPNQEMPNQDIRSQEDVQYGAASAPEMPSLVATPQEMLPQEAPALEMHDQEAPNREMPNRDIRSQEDVQYLAASAQEMPSLGATPQEMLPEEAPTLEMHNQEASNQEMPNQDIRSQEDVQYAAESTQEFPSVGATPQEMLPQDAPAPETHTQEAPSREMANQDIRFHEDVQYASSSAEEMPSLGATPQEMLPQEAPTLEMHTQEAPSQEMPNQDSRYQEDVHYAASSRQEMPYLGATPQEMFQHHAPTLEMHTQEAQPQEMPNQDIRSQEDVQYAASCAQETPSLGATQEMLPQEAPTQDAQCREMPNQDIRSQEVPNQHVQYATVNCQDIRLLSVGDGLSDFDVYISEISSNQHMKSELDQYLEESLLPRVQEFDVLGWWKLNKLKYPTLSKLAADVLSIPISTVGPDSVFDTKNKKIDRYRGSLHPLTLEALICAKDWLQYGSSSSVSQFEASNAVLKLEY